MYEQIIVSAVDLNRSNSIHASVYILTPFVQKENKRYPTLRKMSVVDLEFNRKDDFCFQSCWQFEFVIPRFLLFVLRGNDVPLSLEFELNY